MSDPTSTSSHSQEKLSSAISGWFMLLINCALLFGGVALLLNQLSHGRGAVSAPIVLGAVGMIALAVILFCGLFTLQPNESRVLILFGSYHGTVRHSGFFWANPFYSRSRGQ